MRIADHAVVMQSSQALQQPSNTVHQQQVASPDVAAAAAAVETGRQASQVNRQQRTEGKTIRKEERNPSGGRRTAKRVSGTQTEGDTPSEEADDSIRPPAGGHLDILV